MAQTVKQLGVKNSTPLLSDLMLEGIDAYYGQKNGHQYIKDYSKAYRCFSEAARLGDENATWLIGRMYFYGQGCKQSYRQAATYFKKAALMGVKEARFELARCYFYGLGAKRNEEKAIHYLSLAADQGHALSQDLLARAYLQGEGGLEKNEERAVHYFSLAAEQGIVESQYSLHLRYEYGQGVIQDCYIAMQYLRMAAENGYAPAERKLGKAYYYGDCGLHQDYALAFYWCQRAAKQEDAEAQYCCGLSFQKGEGVKQDLLKAIEYHRAAAKQDYVAAHLQLFRAIVQLGAEEYYKEGFNALLKGAKLNDKDCMYGLSLIYRIGIYGAPCNPEKADYWHRKYAEVQSE